MAKPHSYDVQTRWTGNLGGGTSDYRAYSRQHEIVAAGKRAPIPGSADPVFRGDATRYNPEELLLASISTCHLLWYLHLCADAGIVVVDYVDEAHGTMVEAEDGGGHFTEAVLRPKVSITRAEQVERALALHEEAHRKCFIANSLNFPVKHLPEVRVARGTATSASS
jgi:organic hydroperoxide reductase OsmC/OhrA